MTHRSRPEPFRHQETLAPYAGLLPDLKRFNWLRWSYPVTGPGTDTRGFGREASRRDIFSV